MATIRTSFLLATVLLTAAPWTDAAVLDEIRARGSVRVATTLDYRPFSYHVDGQPAGIDIDLAHRIAARLGVRIEWIATSWPALLDDLREARFDIAMSGISITEARRTAGDFSAPYFETGKALLRRCAGAPVDSLDSLDRPEITVIVNPGGSNQRFVDTHVRHARVIVHPDNVSIFDALAAGPADVMITDAVEAELESARHPALCMPRLTQWLEPVVKAWLLPKDPDWVRTVNAILESLQRDGTLAATIERHVPLQGLR